MLQVGLGASWLHPRTQQSLLPVPWEPSRPFLEGPVNNGCSMPRGGSCGGEGGFQGIWTPRRSTGQQTVRAPLFSLLLFPIISQRCGQVVTGRAAGAQDDSCLQAPSQEEDPGSRGPGHSPFRAEGSGCAGCHLQSYLSGGGCGRPLVQAWTVPRDPWPSHSSPAGSRRQASLPVPHLGFHAAQSSGSPVPGPLPAFQILVM